MQESIQYLRRLGVDHDEEKFFDKFVREVGVNRDIVEKEIEENIYEQHKVN